MLEYFSIFQKKKKKKIQRVSRYKNYKIKNNSANLSQEKFRFY